MEDDYGTLPVGSLAVTIYDKPPRRPAKVKIPFGFRAPTEKPAPAKDKQ